MRAPRIEIDLSRIAYNAEMLIKTEIKIIDKTDESWPLIFLTINKGEPHIYSN